MKTAAAAILLAVASMVPPAIVRADCGGDGQQPCTGPVPVPVPVPVPTVDQVMAVVNELIDSDIPAANKTDIVTPGFTPDEA
jgi:hypothetical protein